MMKFDSSGNVFCLGKFLEVLSSVRREHLSLKNKWCHG